LIIRMIW